MTKQQPKSNSQKLMVFINGYQFRIEGKFNDRVYWRCAKDHKFKYICLQTHILHRTKDYFKAKLIEFL